MSDGRSVTQETNGRAAGAVGRVMPEHEATIAMIRELVEEMIEERAPVMATVVGRDGGTLRLHLDHEVDPRSVGVPRSKGVRHQVGDRVLAVQAIAGEWMVVANLTTAEGAAQQAVGIDELFDDSVDDKKLRTNSVRGSGTGGTKSHIQGGSISRRDLSTSPDDRLSGDHIAGLQIDTGHIRNNAVNGDKLAPTSVDTGHVVNNAINADKLAPLTVARAHVKPNAIGKDELAPGAVDSGHIKKGAVNADKLAGNAVDTANLRKGAVTADKLADKAVDTASIRNAAVTAEKLAGNIPISKLSGEIPGSKLADDFAADDHDHDADYAADNHHHNADYASKGTETVADNAKKAVDALKHKVAQLEKKVARLGKGGNKDK